MNMNTNWKLNPVLIKLLAQIDAKAPHRSKASDGSIGNEEHQKLGARSDHNPNEFGIVNAIDITHDPKGGFNAASFAEALRASKDPRVAYVIFNSRIFSSTVQPWVWRKYNGPSPHDHHVHVSVGGEPVPWKIE